VGEADAINRDWGSQAWCRYLSPELRERVSRGKTFGCVDFFLSAGRQSRETLHPGGSRRTSGALWPFLRLQRVYDLSGEVG
jgi:hypothetical protein